MASAIDGDAPELFGRRIRLANLPAHLTRRILRHCRKPCAAEIAEHSLSYRRPYFLPQFVSSVPRARREWEYAGMRSGVREVLQRPTQSVARKLVCLRSYNQGFASSPVQKFQQLLVVFLRRNIQIDQCEAQCEGLPFLQVRLNECRPTGGDFLRHLGIPISGQVGENQLWLRLPGPSDFEEIDRSRAPRRGTGLRNFCPQQRIDDARFPDVGPSEKCNFRQG